MTILATRDKISLILNWPQKLMSFSDLLLEVWILYTILKIYRYQVCTLNIIQLPHTPAVRQQKSNDVPIYDFRGKAPLDKINVPIYWFRPK